MRNLFSNNVSASEVLRLVQERDAAILERDLLKELLSGSVSASEVLKLIETRDAAVAERDAVRQEMKSGRFAPLSEIAELQAKIAQLEEDVSTRLKPGTEEFDLASAERLRERMRALQPNLPVSTSGVFSFSQHQQELYALETLGFKRNGFFLEIGVGPGTTYSNTYLLEKYFGWKGILCEPNPNYIESIRQSRNSTLDTRAVYSKSGETVRFLCVPGNYGLLSTIAEFTHSDQHNRYGEEVGVQTVTLEDVLTQYNAPRDIDYISLDTEGSEEKILRNFDFNKWNVTILTIEHNLVPGRVDKFDAILCPFGYKRVHQDISGGDAWYQRQA
jgi:FkbM family methyltransferase